MSLTSSLWAASSTAAAAVSYASSFAVFQEPVKQLFGSSPTLEVLHENKSHPFAHEGGVFIEKDNTLFITSNRFNDSVTEQQRIQITRVSLPPSNDAKSIRLEEVQTDHVPMANGGVNYKDGVLFCAQGTLNTSGGLAFMESKPPYKSELLLTSFYGRDFNSLNDVAVHSDGSVWFTDPIYGSEQGIRPKPRLPSQVYRFDPKHNSVRVIADGFGRPNGITFSPDQKTVYVTDTDRIHGDGTEDLTRPSSIYAFDVTNSANGPFLTNRRLFAMPDTGIPDGVKCDVHGNVYSGCGDGINIWSPAGVLIGKILVEGGAANFCFGRNGEIFILNENRLLRAKLAPSTKGALLGI
ncbi:hypothetical protein QQS21_010943 [Conoideocrella luteorostrata]|uniref:SMP-30/Gluconolactonase/LRE-like region domain-containing protein n=1 Tax=Conoideocrella luteorostrata TaxID=1105319 RepID=A0AAJ0CII2_9HYPO|nr:hypothetical protein QQS21_010943 [Conoideocrella luteorostrata]